MDSVVLGQAFTVGVFVAFHFVNRYSGKKKDHRQDEKLDLRFAVLREENERSFATVRSDIAEVRAFCVGPDGQNGFRKDIDETKERVDGLETRERERLQAKAYDRRSGS